MRRSPWTGSSPDPLTAVPRLAPAAALALTLALWLGSAAWSDDEPERKPEPPRIAETVTVVSGDAPVPGEPLARRYDGDLVRSLSSVAASDPLRAVQALPGVAANDDFHASFAARGAGFGAAGLYVDGVRLEAPFHTIRDINDGYTLTIFNADVVESLSLLPGTAPARYGDRVGAVLAVRTREGRRDGFHGRATAGAAGVFATLEGPLGARASWIASARKSFLGYVVERATDDSQLVLGWHDLTARLTLRPRPSQTLSLVALVGRSEYRNTEATPGLHELLTAAAGTDLVHLSWRRGTSGQTLGATAFVLHQTGQNRDSDGFERFASDSLQGGVQAEATWQGGSHRFEAGLEARRLGEDVLSRRFETPPGAPRTIEDYRRDGWLLGAFLQGTWQAAARVSLTFGGRLDRFEATRETLALPRASLEVGLTRSTRLLAAFGGYAQFPRFAQLAGERGNPELDAERSRQAALAVEQRLPAGLSLRVEAYTQSESRLIFNRELEYRLVAGRVVRPEPAAVLRNALGGPSRGLELTLQRQAGPVSGFVSFAWAHARRSDGQGSSFDADFDQRHTLTAFVRTRLGSSAFVTSAFRHGSGFPLPGFLRETPAGVFVAEPRNGFGPPPYNRFDVRAEKRFVRGRVTLGLFLELANVIDHDNVRYSEIASVNPATGRTRIDRDSLMPRVPLFGASVEF